MSLQDMKNLLYVANGQTVPGVEMCKAGLHSAPPQPPPARAAPLPPERDAAVCHRARA